MALYGKTFYIDMTSGIAMHRPYFVDLLESYEGQVEPSITSSVTHIIVGAHSVFAPRGCTVISETNVHKMIAANLPSSSSSQDENSSPCRSLKKTALLEIMKTRRRGRSAKKSVESDKEKTYLRSSRSKNNGKACTVVKKKTSGRTRNSQG